MKLSPVRPVTKGVTLVELTVVIVVLVLMASASFVGVGAYLDWAKGKEASEVLREVYNAQKQYMADHPHEQVSSISQSDITPYMTGGNAAGYTFPTIEALDGSAKTINVDVMPPTIQGGYDPSGSTTDNLWDIGE